MVTLRVGQETQSTFPQYYTNNPVFEQGFVFMVVNPDADDLHVKIVDTRKDDSVLAYTTVRSSDIIARPKMELSSQPINLKGASSDSTITLTTFIRPLMPPKSRSNVGQQQQTQQQQTKPQENKVVQETPKVDKVDEVPPAPKVVSCSFPKEEIVEEDTPLTGPPVAIGEMLGGIVQPMADTAGKDLLNQNLAGGELRRRVMSMASTEPTTATGCGKIRMSLRYDQEDEKLRVTVHQASGLPGGHLPDPPDPYVKMYLLPEKSKSSKRKTDVIKDTVDPVFEEEFEFKIPIKRIGETQLQVSVIDRKGIFARSPLMGRSVIDLDNPKLSTSGGLVEWFSLYEDDDDSD